MLCGIGWGQQRHSRFPFDSATSPPLCYCQMGLLVIDEIHLLGHCRVPPSASVPQLNNITAPSPFPPAPFPLCPC